MSAARLWVNGRTLLESIKETGARHRFEGIRPNDRVELDLQQDAYALGIERKHSTPFVMGERLFVTIDDFDMTGSEPMFRGHASIISMANMNFTRRALDCAISRFIADDDDNLTLLLELTGANLDCSDAAAVREFSYQVVERWGRSGRVWGNLKRFHGKDGIGVVIGEWLAACRDASILEAITGGIAIKGLGVSFASKHLRFLDPDRFATLDDVLCKGLGYALNPAGYSLMLQDLARLRDEHALPYRVADIESGLFVLIRQVVRGTNQLAQ